MTSADKSPRSSLARKLQQECDACVRFWFMTSECPASRLCRRPGGTFGSGIEITARREARQTFLSRNSLECGPRDPRRRPLPPGASTTQPSGPLPCSVLVTIPIPLFPMMASAFELFDYEKMDIRKIRKKRIWSFAGVPSRPGDCRVMSMR